MNIQEEIKTFLREKKFIKEEEEIGSEDSLLEQGVIDSVGIQEIVSFMEKKYSISVDEDDLMPDNFDTLNDMERYIQEKLNG
ncbi:MAG: phosphopantetheine-binding protein [Nitrospinota bacterium]